MPESINNLSKALLALGIDDPLEKLALIASHLCALKARRRRGAALSLAELLSFKAELYSWERDIPDEYSYETLAVEQSQDIFVGRYHSYSSSWTAAAWNKYRCFCLLVNELILEYLDSPHMERSQYTKSVLTLQHDKAKFQMMQHTSDICASVPYYLGSQWENLQRPRRQSVVACQLLIWPLYFAGSMENTSDAMREWVIMRLIRLGHTIGSMLPITLAEVLTGNSVIYEWRGSKEGRKGNHELSAGVNAQCNVSSELLDG
jgi:hypothetical protein